MTRSRAKQAGQTWGEVAEEVFCGVRAWREQHPRATFKELEIALDERLARLRARMLTDTAMQSAAADLRQQPAARPVCPDCGGRLVLAGQEERVLTTTFDQALAVRRSAMVCTACHRRIFPPR